MHDAPVAPDLMRKFAAASRLCDALIGEFFEPLNIQRDSESAEREIVHASFGQLYNKAIRIFCGG